MVKIFCERLKNLRKENKLSQPRLAQLLGVSNGMISMWENGVHEPTIGHLLKLSEIFGVSSDFLLGLSDY